jgi:hypothetical protein
MSTDDRAEQAGPQQLAENSKAQLNDLVTNVASALDDHCRCSFIEEARSASGADAFSTAVIKFFQSQVRHATVFVSAFVSNQESLRHCLDVLEIVRDRLRLSLPNYRDYIRSRYGEREATDFQYQATLAIEAAFSESKSQARWTLFRLESKSPGAAGLKSTEQMGMAAHAAVEHDVPHLTDLTDSRKIDQNTSIISSATAHKKANETERNLTLANQWLGPNPYSSGEELYQIFEDARFRVEEELSLLDSKFVTTDLQKVSVPEYVSRFVGFLMEKFNIATKWALHGIVWSREGALFFINRYDSMAAGWIDVVAESPSSMPDAVRQEIVHNLKLELRIGKSHWKAEALKRARAVAEAIRDREAHGKEANQDRHNVRSQSNATFDTSTVALNSRHDRKGDHSLLAGKEHVAKETALRYLGIGERQLEQLSKDGVLIKKGQRMNARYEVSSLEKYLPPNK